MKNRPFYGKMLTFQDSFVTLLLCILFLTDTEAKELAGLAKEGRVTQCHMQCRSRKEIFLYILRCGIF